MMICPRSQGSFSICTCSRKIFKSADNACKKYDKAFILGTWQRTDWFVRLCFGPLELVGGALGGYIGIRLLGYRIPMVIEADGISVERRGKIRWDQIARIETSKVFFLPTGVILFLTDGQEVELGGAAGGGKRFDLLVKERWERHTRR